MITSGFVSSDDPFHGIISIDVVSTQQLHQPTIDRLLPGTVTPRVVPIPSGGSVYQWAPSVGSRVFGFRPALDCDGYFATSNFQPHNACYNYACNVASNSVAQPGRLHLRQLPTFQDSNGVEICPPPHVIRSRSEADGLHFIADANTPLSEIPRKCFEDGHLVALLISEPDPAFGWSGDYHWVRCDDREGLCWSQKNGPDLPSALDWAGCPITDPNNATWIMNNGPISKDDLRDLVVEYTFFAWMLIPNGGVNII